MSAAVCYLSTLPPPWEWVDDYSNGMYHNTPVIIKKKVSKIQNIIAKPDQWIY